MPTVSRCTSTWLTLTLTRIAPGLTTSSIANPGQTLSPSSGSPMEPFFQRVLGTTRPSIGERTSKASAVCRARAPTRAARSRFTCRISSSAAAALRFSATDVRRLGSLASAACRLRVFFSASIRGSTSFLVVSRRASARIVLGRLDRGVVDRLLQLQLRLLLADVLLELLPLGLLVNRLAQRLLAVELDDHVALLDVRALGHDVDDGELPVHAGRRDQVEELDGFDEAVQAQRGRRRWRLRRGRGAEHQRRQDDRQHTKSNASRRRWRAGHGGRSLRVRGTPMIVPRGDATKQAAAAVSIRLGSDLDGHDTRDDDVSRWARLCWLPLWASPVRPVLPRRRGPRSGPPPPATGRSSAVPSVMASRRIPTC